MVAAGLFRVLGQEFAELPLIATAKANQRKVSITSYTKKLKYKNDAFHHVFILEHFVIHVLSRGAGSRTILCFLDAAAGLHLLRSIDGKEPY